MNSNIILLFVAFASILCRGGASKCVGCPPCMVCDQLIGCVYDNFSPCISGIKNGLCLYGKCNTSIVNIAKVKPPPCKTYKFTRIAVNGTSKLSAVLSNDINGLSCTKAGALLESVCINGVCTPYVLGIDKTGQPTGCNGLPDGFLCDTNMVFTDGEKCVKQQCIMSETPQSCSVA